MEISRQMMQTNIPSPAVQPNQAPIGADPSGKVSGPNGPSAPASPTNPVAPDLGGGLSASLFAKPDVVSHAPKAVQAAPANATLEKACMYQAGRQIAGGLQGVRHLCAQEAPSAAKALELVTTCYAEANDTTSLAEIDAEVPVLFTKALMHDARIQEGLSSVASSMEEVCKEQLTALFDSTDADTVDAAKQFFTGLRDQLQQEHALDGDTATLLRCIVNLAEAKSDNLHGVAMATFDEVLGENSPLLASYDAVAQAKASMADANSDRHLDTAERQLLDMKTQCFTLLAARSECRVKTEIDDIVGENFTDLRNGEGAMNLDEMMQGAMESPLLTKEMRENILNDINEFSQESLRLMPENLASQVEDLHVRTGADGKVLMHSGNLEAREIDLRQEIMNTTIAGHGQEEALQQLSDIMTNLRAERSEGLHEVLTGQGELGLTEAQCQTLTILLGSEEVSYDPQVVDQIRNFGTGLAAHMDTIALAMQEDATVEQKFAGAKSLDTMLMDNPLMGDMCLAMKESFIPADVGDIMDASATPHEIMMANHKAVCAKSELVAAIGDSQSLVTALSHIDMAAGCDKHHVASLHVGELMGLGVGSDAETQAASVLLFHAACTEHVASLAAENLTPEQSDAYFADFALSLPPKLQDVLGKGVNDLPALEGACTAGITSQHGYDVAVKSIGRATKHFNGERARNALKSLGGNQAIAQTKLAKERLMNVILANISTSAGVAGTQNLAAAERLAIQQHVVESAFGNAVKAGDPRDVGGQYVDTIAALEVQQYEASHNDVIQGIMQAQGVSDLRDLKGDSMAVALQFVSRVLTTSVHDLAVEDLARIGLTHSDLSDTFALSQTIKHMDWDNVDSGFAMATVAHQLYAYDCHDKGVKIPNAGDFVAFAESLGVPKSFESELRQAYATLRASDSERKEALQNLALHPSNTHSVGKLHVDFATMKTTHSAHFSTKAHEKDSSAQADSRAFTRLLADYTEHSGSAASLKDISDQLQTIIGTYKPQMDAVLMLQDRGKTSVADTMTKIEKDVFVKSGAASDLYTAARASVRSDAMGVVGTSQQLRATNEHIAKQNASEATGLHGKFTSKVDKEHHGFKAKLAKIASPISQRIHARSLTHPSKEDKASMALLQTSLLSAFEASGAKTFAAFGQQYQAELAQSHGAVGQTSICQNISQELQSFGMNKATADARAHDLLVGYKTSLPRLLKSTIKQVHAEKLELELTRNAELRKDNVTLTDVRYNMCAEATNNILDELGTGDAVFISTGQKATLKIGLPSAAGINFGANYSNELRKSIMLTKDESGRPALTMSAEMIKSLAASASVVGFFAKVTGSFEHASGIRMSFKDAADCSNFMASIFTGGASEDDLAHIDEIHFLNENAGGVGFFAKADVIGLVNKGLETVGKSMDKARLEASASGQMSHSVAHERHRNGETTRITNRYQIGATAAVGFGGQKKIEVLAKRSLANTLGSGMNIRMAGRDPSIHGLRANISYAVENTLEIDYAESHGRVLNGVDQRVVKGARQHISSSFQAVDGNSDAMARDFMEKHNVPQSEQKTVAAWLAQNKPGTFSLVITNEVKAGAIEHKTADEAKKALSDSNNFTFGGVAIKTSQGAFSSKRYVPIGNLTLRYDVEAHRAKAVKIFNRNRQAV